MQKNQPPCHCKAADNHIIFDCCHCEERSDVAIPYKSNLFFLLIFFFTFLAVKR